MNFESAVQALIDAGVEFIIIGGWSAILHGSIHVTNDLDIFYARTPANIMKLVEALRPFHPRPRDTPANLPFVWDAATLGNTAILTLRTDLGPIDFLAEVIGLPLFQEVQASSVSVEAFGRQIRTLDLPNLIQSKRATGRSKDLSAARELEALLEAREPEP
jgi:predicted nucleotidyltransferase